MSPDAPHHSILDRYTPATLGAVTAIHQASETGGVSVLVDGAEHKFRLPVHDLTALRDDLTMFITAHLSRRDHLPGSEAGAGTPQTSASSTAACTAAWRE